MQVLILTQLRGAHGSFEAGDTPDLPDDVAEAWVDAGAAEYVDVPEASEAGAAPQTATTPPSRTAVRAPAKPSGKSRPRRASPAKPETSPPAAKPAEQTAPDPAATEGAAAPTTD